MTDYRLVMSLLVQGYPYRQIEVMAACSHRTIAKVKRVLTDEAITTREQVDAFSRDNIDEFFTDGRKVAASGYVPVDIERVTRARLGRKKPPLKMLWSKYLQTDAPEGSRYYGYERFCQIVSEHVRVNDLSMPIAHVPGHTMQVDWAGTQMTLTDPITRNTSRVPVFVASLPYSGMVFARGCSDEKMPAWLDSHRQAFEYFGGVTQVIVPDNASTASNQISRHERARDVNTTYANFLEYYQCAAVPTRIYRPKDKGNVESGVKVVTTWVIQYLEDQVFASLDDLNAAVAIQVEFINDRTPFRGEPTSRRRWFEENEQAELLDLPEEPWREVVWRKAKVNRDWHIQIDTIKYSVPYEFAGLSVDVRIVGTEVTILAAGDIVATHRQGQRRNGFVTDPAHAPAHYEDFTKLWTRAYFIRQAHKAGPGTVAALTRLLDGKVIEAQGFRSCMNILDLGKNGNRSLLEEACRQLCEEDPSRQISYTAVKHRLTAVRAHHDARPTSGQPQPTAMQQAKPRDRDTSRAHLAGAEAFTLDALTQPATQVKGDDHA